ncbi:hypothetical protein HDU67_004425 [Dinochytrium kinnereticum]|nr:hypothetical protein HDU67_004425 [Dinochytrium kinnereticum]
MLKIKNRARGLTHLIDRAGESFSKAFSHLERSEALHHSASDSLSHLRKTARHLFDCLDGLYKLGFHSSLVLSNNIPEFPTSLNSTVNQTPFSIASLLNGRMGSCISRGVERKEVPVCPDDQADPVLENPYFLFCQVHVCLARIAYRNGEFEIAMIFLWEGLKAFPMGVEGRMLLAKTLRVMADKKRDLEDVEEELDKAVFVGSRLEKMVVGEVQVDGEAQGGEADNVEGAEEGDDEDDVDEDLSMDGDDGVGEYEEEDDVIATATFQRELDHARQAQDLLILLHCQEGRPEKSQSLLTHRGYVHRLSDHVLRYPLPNPTLSRGPYRSDVPFVKAVDHALPPAAFHHMRRTFSPRSLFWAEHRYGMGSPYFSYVHPLNTSKPPSSALDQVIGIIHDRVSVMFPKAKEAKYAEWWAHCRPHSDGHQLHFDSDDEGRERVGNGRPHHPFASAVIYLGEVDGLGGPTFVTNQRIGDGLADRGWVVFPKLNRLASFDGSVLHGVIPGRGFWPNNEDRRVTFMVAFWDDIQVKSSPDETPGSSRPYPDSRNTRFSWPVLHEELLDLDNDGEDDIEPVPCLPVPVESVWVRCDEEVIEIDEEMEQNQDDVVEEEDRANEGLEEDGGEYEVEEIGYSAVKHGETVPPYHICFQGF